MIDQAVIHEKCISEDIEDHLEAIKLLKIHFSNLPDKYQAWKDLHELTHDKSGAVRWEAADALGFIFNQVPDKYQAWQDLHRLTYDENKFKAAEALGLAFNEIPNKDHAWQDLHRLTQDQNSSVRFKAAEALGLAFNEIPNKDQAWQDLHSLTQDNQNRFVQFNAACAMISVFREIPNKDQAWQDLIRLTQNYDWDVKRSVLEVLGSIFNQVPDKDQAWQDLVRLTQDQDSGVRMYAYHSLGSASVAKATEAENRDRLLSEIKTAIIYFEKSCQEGSWWGPARPARFCLPFYRSYFAITFQSAKEDEVKRYLDEAKSAVGSSDSKAELIEAVENLAKALQESQKLKSRSIEEISNELNAYRWYCEKAAYHMAAAEESAPGAVRLMRRCNPILEERIQVTIEEIQERARQICRVTRGTGTEYEAPGAEIYRASKCLSLDDPIKAYQCCMKMASTLRALYKVLPPEMGQSAEVTLENIERGGDLSFLLDGMNKLITDAYPYIKIALNFEANLNKATEDIIESNTRLHHETRGEIIDYILERLDQNQKIIVKAVLKALEENGDHDQQFKELLDRLDAFISELEQNHIEDPALKNDVDEYNYLKDSELNIKDRLVFTIPLIPLFLTYQGIIELQSGLNLLAAWDKLTSSFARK